MLKFNWCLLQRILEWFELGATDTLPTLAKSRIFDILYWNKKNTHIQRVLILDLYLSTIFAERNGSVKQQWDWNCWPKPAITLLSKDYTVHHRTWVVGRTQPVRRDLQELQHRRPICTTAKQLPLPPYKNHCRIAFILVYPPWAR